MTVEKMDSIDANRLRRIIGHLRCATDELAFFGDIHSLRVEIMDKTNELIEYKKCLPVSKENE